MNMDKSMGWKNRPTRHLAGNMVALLGCMVAMALPWQACVAADNAAPIPPHDATLEAFFKPMDLVYTSAKYLSRPTGLPPVGNGLIAGQFRCEGNTLRIQVDRQDAYALKCEKKKGVTRAVCRYSFGDVVIKPQGDISEVTARVDLWNATATARIQTGEGDLQVSMFAPFTQDVLVIHMKSTGGEQEAGVAYRAHNVAKLWASRPWDTGEDMKERREGDLHVCVQPNDVSGERTVVWCEERLGDHERLIFLALDCSMEGPSAEDPIAQVTAARKLGLEALQARHRQDWHDLWRRHFISWPDSRMQAQYWIGIYRFCSQFRPGGPIGDNSGLWAPARMHWGWLTCDYNAGAHFPIAFAANLADRAEPLIRTLNENVHYLNANLAPMIKKDPYVIGVGRTTTLEYMTPRRELLDTPRRTIDDIPDDLLAGADLNPQEVRGVNGNKQPLGSCEEPANMAHILHGYYRYYRMTMDEQAARRFQKLCKLNMRTWLYCLGDKREDGRYHLDKCISPEAGFGPDANYGLSAIQWLCRTLLELDERWQLQDPERALWQDVRSNLAPYPTLDGVGYVMHANQTNQSMWGKDQAKHRHWSHLYQIYPYWVVTPDQPGVEALIRQSLQSYTGMNFGDGATIPMYCCLGEGNAARDKFHASSLGVWIFRTLFETPLLKAEVQQHFFLQDWGNAIRVFPAIPDDWSDVSLYRMRAEGAFNVSAVRRGGKTEWVHIASDAGEPCVVVTDLARPIEAVGDRAFTVTAQDGNKIVIDLGKGESVLLKTKGTTPDLRVGPVANDGWDNWLPERGAKKSSGPTQKK